MNITAVESVEAAGATAVAIGMTSDGEVDPAAASLVEDLGDPFRAYLEHVDFSGATGTSARYHHPDGPVDTVVVVGLGDEPTADTVRQAAGRAARKLSKADSAATTLASREEEGAAQAAVEGAVLGAYSFDRYKSDAADSLDSLIAVTSDDEAVRRGEIVARGVTTARDLINTPAADKSPDTIVDLVVDLGDSAGFRVVVERGDELVDARYGGLLGVAAGSDRPPAMVQMWHEPDDAAAFVAIVGKGITFDSGGLSLKPAAGMETMKTDMSGAAAVVGAMSAIASLGVPVRVVGITPLTDNMPGGSATKPGDVLTIRNGKTIEVLNTDAEGRLVLADGLSLAVEFDPDVIVDLATLTGACKVALGEKIAGAMGNDDAFVARVQAAGADVGERIWPLPLPDDYRKLIDSPIADMKNTGGRFGGAITAAHLLAEFVDDRPWAHLDIAGPARWPDDEHYQTKGGSGFGVRTLVQLVEDIAATGA